MSARRSHEKTQQRARRRNDGRRFFLNHASPPRSLSVPFAFSRRAGGLLDRKGGARTRRDDRLPAPRRARVHDRRHPLRPPPAALEASRTRGEKEARMKTGATRRYTKHKANRIRERERDGCGGGDGSGVAVGCRRATPFLSSPARCVCVYCACVRCTGETREGGILWDRGSPLDQSRARK